MSVFLDGIPLRISPQSVSWPYTLKMATHKTMGGKVVQLYGVSLGDLVVEGVFGKGGPDEQLRFFNRVVEIIDTQMQPGNERAKPVRFFWPQRGWDFWCYVKGITEIDAGVAVVAENRRVNPGYRLTLFIQEDNGEIVRAARDSAAAAFIGRLTKGLGWKRTEWNGPLGNAELTAALSGATVLDTLFAVQGRSSEGNKVAVTDPTGSNGVVTAPDGTGD